MVLRARAGNGIADLVTAGLDTVAIRVPGHPIALDLIRNSGCAIAAPSANRSGHVSPTTAVHVADDLGHLGFTILDGGPCRHGLESTIVDLSGRDAMLLRQGAVTRERVAEAIGEIVHSANVADADRPTAPGQLASHYAPRAQVRLNVIDPRPGEALLAIGPDTPKHDGPSYNLSITGDLVEAAANLFAALRLLDSSGVASIAVMPIAHVALGAAINDRLRRAAVR
jgi:L-threonylcarbamoyladenylate synthase